MHDTTPPMLLARPARRVSQWWVMSRVSSLAASGGEMPKSIETVTCSYESGVTFIAKGAVRAKGVSVGFDRLA